MSAVLALDNVSAGYGRSIVLNGVSLSVGQETVVLLGPNGSGKSTIAKTIMSLTSLYGGRIELNGLDISRVATWRRVRMGLGYVPQVENIFRTLTVEENLSMGMGDCPRLEAARRLAETYALFPALQVRRRVSAGNLSGGERRLLAFATTLVQDPKLLILDEPTSDLAPAAIDLIFEKIREVRDRFRIPLLMIEQNVERALELADRVYVLVRGRAVVERSAGEIDETEIGMIFLEHAAGKIETHGHKGVG
jgi:ABC-type branched-subunit amino acid transport system ATPase component